MFAGKQKLLEVLLNLLMATGGSCKAGSAAQALRRVLWYRCALLILNLIVRRWEDYYYAIKTGSLTGLAALQVYHTPVVHAALQLVLNIVQQAGPGEDPEVEAAHFVAVHGLTLVRCCIGATRACRSFAADAVGAVAGLDLLAVRIRPRTEAVVTLLNLAPATELILRLTAPGTPHKGLHARSAFIRCCWRIAANTAKCRIWRDRRAAVA